MNVDPEGGDCPEPMVKVPIMGYLLTRIRKERRATALLLPEVLEGIDKGGPMG